jgi:hypothetical protein
MFRVVVMAAMAVILASCATPYQQGGITGGSDVKELRPDVYRVSFQGNGYTTRESVQVYWLYRCAELAIEKGFTGFEILSDMQFVMRRPPAEDRIGAPLAVASLRTRIPVSPAESTPVALWRHDVDLANRSMAPVRLARGGAAFIYIPGGGAAVPKPGIEGDVHFLSKPVPSAPPKIFNARELLAQLEPLVKAERCSLGNICPHVHEYLLPKGKLQ